MAAFCWRLKGNCFTQRRVLELGKDTHPAGLDAPLRIPRDACSCHGAQTCQLSPAASANPGGQGESSWPAMAEGLQAPQSISQARPKSPSPSKPEGQTLPLSPTPRATCWFLRATRPTPNTELLSVHSTQNTVLREPTFLRSR